MNSKDKEQHRANENDRPGQEDDPLQDSIGALKHLFSLAIEQLLAVKQLALAETRLSLRYLLIALTALLCFAVLMVSTWLTLLAVAGWYLFQLGLPVTISLLLLFLGQGLTLYLSYIVVCQAVRRIGLKETQQSIKTAISTSANKSSLPLAAANSHSTGARVH